jgi:hypothetical protein
MTAAGHEHQQDHGPDHQHDHQPGQGHEHCTAIEASMRVA